MNDRSPLKTDNYTSNKRKAGGYLQTSMNSSEANHSLGEVNPKKGKTISHEELSELIKEIEAYSLSNGKKSYMIPTEWWNIVIAANKKGANNEVPQISVDSLYGEDLLKEDLKVNRDFRLVPEDMFMRLRNAFGVSDKYEVPIYSENFDAVNGSESKDGKSAVATSLSQRELGTLIKTVEEEKLTLGDTWFVVSKQWWNIVYQAYKNGYPEDITPISAGNISYRDGNKWLLKTDLNESADYIYLPERVFDRFSQVFGMENPSRDYIKREVVYKGKMLVLQTYSRSIFVCLARNKKVSTNVVLTGTETMDELRNLVLEKMNLFKTPLANLRFYITSTEGAEHWELIDPAQTNINVYFDTSQKVAIDVKEDGRWYFDNKKAPGETLLMPLKSKDTFLLGKCGLHNLGNTCFMASAIQCLSNIPSLTDFFLNGNYRNDLNTSNPLGTHGELAQSYADLIRILWQHGAGAITPRRFKATIGQFAPRFSGYNQQDSQELLAYLLDGLHEDLNRIKNKPYTQDEDDLDKLEEHAAARQAWAAYRSRNDSIIVDKFHGQLKSRLVCPSCHKISIKFDPFCFLSVPVPAGRNIPKLSVTLIYNSVPKKKWAKFAMTLSTGMCTVRDVINCVNENLKHTNNHVEGCMFTVGMCSDNVRILDSAECAVGDDIPKMLYIAQLDHSDHKRKYVIVKNHSQQGRPLSLPMIFSYLQITDISKEFIDQKVAFIHSTYHNESSSLSDDAFSVFVDTGDKQYLYPEHLAEPPAGKHVTLIVVWKDAAIFNNYRGDLLIEREVSVQKTRDVHLLDCIDLFTREEQLGEQDSWYCPVCKEHKRATKKLDLWSLPEVLIIHLKRFHYGKFSREKIEDPVYVPVRDFELNDKLANEKHEHVKYDLIACSNHMGGLGGGHYTAFAKHRMGGWFEYNDAYVTSICAPSDPWLDRNAYVLIYHRKEVTLDAAHTDENLEMETE